MDRVLTAKCDRPLEGSAPDWVHLLPMGEMTARDGRQFNLADPQAVIDTFEANAVDLPVDYEHQGEANLKERTGPVPAAGWIKELRADASGLWGRVDWTTQARKLIASKAYRYLSPAFLYAREGKVITQLKGAGLVHKPALHLKALASQEDKTMTGDATVLERLAAILGLPEDATADEVFERIENLISATAAAQSPDPARFVPVEAVQSLLNERHSDRLALAEERAVNKVEGAIGEGHITPGMREWALGLCRSDEASFDEFLNRVAPVFSHLTKPSRPGKVPPGREATSAQSEFAEAVCAQLGLSPNALKD